jgi:hypothetical protein
MLHQLLFPTHAYGRPKRLYTKRDHIREDNDDDDDDDYEDAFLVEDEKRFG